MSTIFVGPREFASHRQSNRGFADTPRSYDRDEAVTLQAPDHGRNDVVAANQSCQADRQVVELALGFYGSVRIRQQVYRRDESITSAWYGRDVTVA